MPVLKKTDDDKMIRDESLEEAAGDLAIDLYLYDNHAEESSFIQVCMTLLIGISIAAK